MNCTGYIKHGRAGFTLVELLVAIAIMGTVMGLSALSFNSWKKKSNIEAQTRDLFTTFMEARNNAFMQKKRHDVELEQKNYVLKSYSSESDAAGKIIRSKALTYKLTKKGADISGTKVSYDSGGFTTGFASTNFTVNVDIDDTSTSLNCLVVYVTRINMGKWNGTACEFR